MLIGADNFLDFAPKGRDEDPWTTASVRRHHEYEDKATEQRCGA